eukprot:3328947-Rhodomonas_salina.1
MAPYARSVPHTAWHHTLAQYRTPPHSTILPRTLAQYRRGPDLGGGVGEEGDEGGQRALQKTVNRRQPKVHNGQPKGNNGQPKVNHRQPEVHNRQPKVNHRQPRGNNRQPKAASECGKEGAVTDLDRHFNVVSLADGEIAKRRSG